MYSKNIPALNKLHRIKEFFQSPRNLYVFGFILTFVLTFLEVSRGRHYNFVIFSSSTIDFWNNIIPYGYDWAQAHHDFFLYGPPFSVLFSPFAFLPDWLGPFVWNLFNFTLYFTAIFTLPAKYSTVQKCNMFLYTLLILATTQLSFQYNVTVAYLFLFAFSLLERGHGFWAIMLIMISGWTKVYGIFELGLLLCYPHLWRNIGYTAFWAIALFLLPLVKLSVGDLIPYYQCWIDGLSAHKDTRIWQTVFYLKPISEYILPYIKYIQISTISILAVILAANYKKYCNPAFRAQALGILMGWVILMGDSSERHTYVIALIGYMLWFYSRIPSLLDKWLFWLNFVVLVVVPVDLLCPPPVMRFLFNTMQLNLYIFIFTWIRMCYITFFRPSTMQLKENL